MNKQIELVKKWLADPDSVTQEELEKNRDAAWAAYAAAAWAVDDDAADAAADWVKKYEAVEQDDE